MASPRIKDRKELAQEWIQRFVAYTDEITWFGVNSVMRAWAIATGTIVEAIFQLYVALLRRFTVFSSKDEDAGIVCAERGAPRLNASRSKVLVIVQPFVANVTAITLGANDKIEVDNSTELLATDSIRIRNGDGTVSETKTIIAITVGTGPNGNDELEVTPLINSYNPVTDDVDVLIRVLVAEGTEVGTTLGVNFETLENVTTGDANPVLDGEGTFLGLADKVWCECTERGASGAIDPNTIDSFTSGPIRGVASIYNPERATGGTDIENDFEMKRRAISGPASNGQETREWFEALAKKGDSDLLRVVRPTDVALGTLILRVLSRSGGPLAATKLRDLESYIEDRVRSHMVIELENVTLTSVEVDAQITIESEATLEEIWREASSRISAYLDFRKREFGVDVDADELRSVLELVPGVASVDVDTFLPASDVTVTDLSLPTLTRISLEDIDTGNTINAALSTVF